MADNKKYYYLKLKEDFFGSDELMILQSMPDGYIYSDILLKLYLKSLRSEGRLMYKGIIPYSPSVLATLTNHRVGTVEKALKIFQELGLIEILDNGAIYMSDIQNFIGESSTEADRKRAYRNQINAEKAKLLEGDSRTDVGQMSGQMSDKNPPENRDKEIEIRDIYNKTFCPEMNSGQPQPKVEIEPAAEDRTKVEIEPSCPQAELMVETEPAQAEEFLRLPLINGDEYIVTRQYVAELQGLYPAVDVEQAIRNMRGWLDANPKNRKTPRGIKRFITGWLAREQDRAPRKTGETQSGTRNRFNNFPQREYDWNTLEQQLLNARGGTTSRKEVQNLGTE